MKLLHEVVKLLRRRTDAEEDRNFDEYQKDAEHQTDNGEDYSLGENVCYAECDAQDHRENTHPLSINTEVPRLELPSDIVQD